jgi:alkylation response protein AidB-like acyl-CoA dehydrogenase
MEVWDHFLGDEERLIRDTARQLARDRIAPRARDVDERAEFPDDNVAALAELGFFGLALPETYGGAGASTFSYLLAVEELARACAATSLIYMTQTNGALTVLVAGSEEQRRRWLPDLASGTKIAALALTEPDAGSDVAAIATRAVPNDGGYVLSGTKVYITNGSRADLVAVYAATNSAPGHDRLSAFVVEKGMPGFRVAKVEKKMGMRGSDTAELVLDDVVVPAENRIGPEGAGFRIAMAVLNKSRLSCAAQALGIAQGAYDIALGYARERRAFGRPVGQHQAVQLILADMYVGIASARTYLYGLAAAVDKVEAAFSKEASVAKTLCSDLAMRVTTDAVQVLGGYGYMQEAQVERMMRDAKVTQIYEGTNQIQRILIARELLGR